MAKELFQELLSYCRLYSGKENNVHDNPFNKDDDEFKWHMWRVEFVSVVEYDSNIINYQNYQEEDRAEEYMKAEIKGGIDMYADAWAGGDSSTYYDKYFSYKR